MEQRDKPSKSEYLDWRGTELTRFLVRDLFDKREELKEGIAEHHYSDTEELNQAIGRCMALKDAIDYILRDFDVVEIDEELVKNDD